MRNIERRGQSVTEYAIVFAVVAAAVIGMQVFLKRGLQAKEKSVTDYYSKVNNKPFANSTLNVGTLVQYEPYYADSQSNVLQDSREHEKRLVGGQINRTAVHSNVARTAGHTAQGDAASLVKDDNWNQFAP